MKRTKKEDFLTQHTILQNLYNPGVKDIYKSSGRRTFFCLPRDFHHHPSYYTHCHEFNETNISGTIDVREKLTMG